MTYTWSEEQRRGLTFGSTIGGRFVQDTAGGRAMVLFADEFSGVPLNTLDPSTLLPPSIEWIRELAKERLGRDSEVEDEFGSVKVAWNDGGCLLAFTDAAGMDRFRAAVAAIVALANAGLGGKGGGDGCRG